VDVHDRRRRRGGHVVEPGLYAWSTGVSITGANLTLVGNALAQTEITLDAAEVTKPLF